MNIKEVQDLSDEEIRIKVAELDGLTVEGNAESDYPNDLNAIHEVVEKLREQDNGLWFDYGSALIEICGSTMNSIQAKARLRCDAFVLAMELGGE